MTTPEDFESKLRQALRPEAVPSDFAAGVMARAGSHPAKIIPFWRTRTAFAMAAVLALCAAIPAGIVEHQRRERAIDASRQLVTALKITREKLVFARQKVRRKHS